MGWFKTLLALVLGSDLGFGRRSRVAGSIGACHNFTLPIPRTPPPPHQTYLEKSQQDSLFLEIPSTGANPDRGGARTHGGAATDSGRDPSVAAATNGGATGERSEYASSPMVGDGGGGHMAAMSTGRASSKRFALQQHDPAADGFEDIDSSTPCPFKISVTNSIADRTDQHQFKAPKSKGERSERSKTAREHQLQVRANGSPTPYIEEESPGPGGPGGDGRWGAGQYQYHVRGLDAGDGGEVAEDLEVEEEAGLAPPRARPASARHRPKRGGALSGSAEGGLLSSAHTMARGKAARSPAPIGGGGGGGVTEPGPGPGKIFSSPPSAGAFTAVPDDGNLNPMSPMRLGEVDGIDDERSGGAAAGAGAGAGADGGAPPPDWAMESWDGEDDQMKLEVASDSMSQDDSMDERLLETNLGDDFLSLFSN